MYRRSRLDGVTRVGLYIWLSAVLGARRGEVVALQWEDIDLDADVVQQPPGQRIDRRTLRPEEEAFDAGVQFRREHPYRARLVSRILGWGDLRDDGRLREVVRGHPSSPSGRLRHRAQTGRRAWRGRRSAQAFLVAYGRILAGT